MSLRLSRSGPKTPASLSRLSGVRRAAHAAFDAGMSVRGERDAEGRSRCGARARRPVASGADPPRGICGSADFPEIFGLLRCVRENLRGGHTTDQFGQGERPVISGYSGVLGDFDYLFPGAATRAPGGHYTQVLHAVWGLLRWGKEGEVAGAPSSRLGGHAGNPLFHRTFLSSTEMDTRGALRDTAKNFLWHCYQETGGDKCPMHWEKFRFKAKYGCFARQGWVF